MKPPPRLRTAVWRTTVASLLVTTGVLALAMPGSAEVVSGSSIAGSILGSAGAALLATIVMVVLAARRPKAH